MEIWFTGFPKTKLHNLMFFEALYTDLQIR